MPAAAIDPAAADIAYESRMRWASHRNAERPPGAIPAAFRDDEMLPHPVGRGDVAGVIPEPSRDLLHISDWNDRALSTDISAGRHSTCGRLRGLIEWGSTQVTA